MHHQVNVRVGVCARVCARVGRRVLLIRSLHTFWKYSLHRHCI